MYYRWQEVRMHLHVTKNWHSMPIMWLLVKGNIPFPHYLAISWGRKLSPSPRGCNIGGLFYRPIKVSFLMHTPPSNDVRGYIEISRGCPFRCGYCQTPSLFGHRMRHRSIDCVVGYAKRLSGCTLCHPECICLWFRWKIPGFDKIENLLSKY